MNSGKFSVIDHFKPKRELETCMYLYFESIDNSQTETAKIDLIENFFKVLIANLYSTTFLKDTAMKLNYSKTNILPVNAICLLRQLMAFRGIDTST